MDRAIFLILVLFPSFSGCLPITAWRAPEKVDQDTASPDTSDTQDTRDTQDTNDSDTQDTNDSDTQDTNVDPDLDKDGWSPAEGDCDDTRADVHPKATELCDGVDNDCDDQIDESLLITFYEDADADGWGDTASAVESCELPKGYAETSGDCDDTRADIHPKAEEICNELDDNCDGGVDEGLDLPWYLDSDLDGFGDPGMLIERCSAPDGWIADSSDCDDTLAEVHPKATEICNEIDDNCDGSIDEFVTTTFYQDLDRDTWGDPLVAIEACSATPGWVLDSTDCEDSDAGVYPGAPEICNEHDDDCDAETDEDVTIALHLDSDLDGYGDPAVALEACAPSTGWVIDESDCDDSEETIHPGADETCNELDDDCDSEIDESVKLIFYYDNDLDGYGNPFILTEACTAEPDWVDNNLDCRDSDPEIHPGALELCDGADNDCDGLRDEGVLLTFYTDSDLDGFGDALSPVLGCELEEGLSAEPTDCDDTVVSTYPGAPELCDELDNDCDTSIDEGLPTVSLYQDSDLDGYGDPAISVLACGARAGWVLFGTDCDDAHPAVNPGMPELCDNGIDDDCDGFASPACALSGEIDLSKADTVYENTPASSIDGAGGALAAVGDIDLDGYDDFVVGISSSSSADTTGSGAWIVRGPPDPGPLELEEYGHRYTSETVLDGAGVSVGAGGDINGDGYPDVLIGAPTHSTLTSILAGRAYAIFGPGSDPGSSSLGSADIIFTGASTGLFGTSIAGVGDFNGDAADDILIGSPSSGSSGRGGAYLFYGPLSAGTVAYSLASVRLEGTYTAEASGSTVAGAGDTNGDGYQDLMIGAPYYYRSTGRVFLLNGSDSYSGLTSLLAADVVLTGITAGDYAGRALAGGSDLNDDGYDDILIGAPLVHGGSSDRGCAYLFLGPVDPTTYSLSESDASFSGASTGDEAASSLAFPGDVDLDGTQDILVGAPEVGSVRGAGYLVYGPFTGAMDLSGADAILSGETSDNAAGAACAGGDIDGSGGADILIGAPGFATTSGGLGAVYLLRGNDL